MARKSATSTQPRHPFRADNDDFEAWLARHCAVVRKDLDKKHEKMRDDAFTFLRATYFRWARRIETVCPELAAAPRVLSVGDVHLENFGTWRDAEGRLIWGINDFDEAAAMPYPFDLVRLVTSAILAPSRKPTRGAIAAAVLRGYRRGLAAPRPTLLDENETWMRPLVTCTDDERDDFWRDIDKLKRAKPPEAVARGLRRSLPPGATIARICHRAKGGGGLGRPRFVADAVWCGGRVVREAKALVPSAWHWAHATSGTSLQFMALASSAYRAPDPWLDVHRGFVFRRIAADSRKVDLDASARAGVSGKLLEAMGFDLGAIHAATRKKQLKEISADLRPRRGPWLLRAAMKMAADVERDFAEWTA